MTTRRTYTKDQRTKALTLYETHGPTHVHKTLGIPKSTVDHWARIAGVRTVRSEKTAAATEARKIDARAVRSDLASVTVVTASEALQLVRARIAAGVVKDTKDLAITYGILVDKHMALVKVDNDNGTTNAVAMIDRLILGLEDLDVDPGDNTDAETEKRTTTP